MIVEQNNGQTSTGRISAEVRELAERPYQLGFMSDIDTDVIPKGLSEDEVRLISSKKNEPAWLLDWRLQAYRHWLTMEEPEWQNARYATIDFQDIGYYAAPKPKPKLSSIDEVDPELRAMFDKLGISLFEQERLSNVAVDAIVDSVSVATTYKIKLAEIGVIFCSFSEAVAEHPDLVRANLGSVVPPRDNYFAALNSAVFSDGSFCYIPTGVRCPMELSTYFRINSVQTGQFERTLIVAEEGSYVSYLEGCTAPMRDENQLHAAVVELVAQQDAQIKYATVQNWYPGDAQGKGGIYNFVTKRGTCAGDRAKISWTQVETGSAITWMYPSVILKGDDSVGEFDMALVMRQLETVFDPEIPVNVVDLGLIYSCEAAQQPDGRYRIGIEMSMTAPGCGMGDVLRSTPATVSPPFPASAKSTSTSSSSGTRRGASTACLTQRVCSSGCFERPMNYPPKNTGTTRRSTLMKVWIDQDLCTGDGLCEEIAPDVFFSQDDGLFYVKEDAANFGSEKKFDGAANPAGAEGMARIPDGGLDRVIEAAEECPGECIFIEID